MNTPSMDKTQHHLVGAVFQPLLGCCRRSSNSHGLVDGDVMALDDRALGTIRPRDHGAAALLLDSFAG
jgi:hypothetical protein